MTITFDKAQWYTDSEGFWLALRTKDRRTAASISQSVGEKPWTAELKEYRKRRSLDANAYCWVLLHKLSEKLGLPPEEIYRGLVKEVGGNCEIVCVPDKAVDKLRETWGHNRVGWLTETMPSKLEGCTNVLLYCGSSVYDTAQMSRLIDLVVNECKQQGIETATPAEIDNMIDLWGRE